MVGQAENTGFEPLLQPDRYIGNVFHILFPHLLHSLSPNAFRSCFYLSPTPRCPATGHQTPSYSQCGLPQPSHPLSFSCQTALPFLAGHFHILDGTLVAIPLCSKRSDKDALTWGLRSRSTWGYVEAANALLQVGVPTQRFRMSERESYLDFY